MPHPHPTSHASPLLTGPLLTALLLTGPAIAQAEPQTPAQTSVSAPAATAPAAPTLSPGAAPAVTPTPSSTPAQQAVLDRIRRLRDGDQRRFGSCSYRWDRWKLLADGNRTTTYSCEGTAIVDRTIGVNCSKLQINSYEPLPQAKDKGDGKPEAKGEGWAWGTWRLPQPGGEEQMVATLCANALPAPPAPAKPTNGAAPATKTPASPR